MQPMGDRSEEHYARVERERIQGEPFVDASAARKKSAAQGC